MDGDVVEVELLQGLRQVGLGVDEALEVGNGEAGGQVEADEFLVEVMVGGDDRYGDPRPSRRGRSALGVGCTGPAQARSDSETHHKSESVTLELTWCRCRIGSGLDSDCSSFLFLLGVRVRQGERRAVRRVASLRAGPVKLLHVAGSRRRCWRMTGRPSRHVTARWMCLHRMWES